MLLAAKEHRSTSHTYSMGLMQLCEQATKILLSVSDLASSHSAFRYWFWDNSPELPCHHYSTENY